MLQGDVAANMISMSFMAISEKQISNRSFISF